MRSSPKIREIAARDLRRHPVAQRTNVNKALAKEIAGNLNLAAIGVLTGSKQTTGEVLLIDGATRHEGILIAGRPELKLKVAVYESLTAAEEHELFLRCNRRKDVGSYDKFFNGLQARRPECVGANRVMLSLGLTPSDQAKDGNIACVTRLTDTYDKLGPEVLRLAVGTAIEAWGTTSAAVEGQIVDGLARLYGKYNGTIDQKVLVGKLSKLPGGPSGLIGAARSQQNTRGGAVGAHVADIAKARYNAGRRGGALV